MTIRPVLKYNFIKRIAGLHKTSRRLAGKECLLDRKNSLVYIDPLRSMRRDGICVAQQIGDQLLRTGKFPSLCKIIFPLEPAKVMDFIRLVVRTGATVGEAATAAGVQIDDLSRYQVKTA